MNEIRHKLKTTSIIVVGDVMLDSYVWGKISGISPEANVPVLSVTRKEYRAGGAANVAINLKSLGCKPILMGITGNDEGGQQLRSILTAQEIDTNNLLTDSSRITTEKQRMLNENEHMMRSDYEVKDDLPDQLQFEFINHFKTACELYKVDACILQDYNKGVLTERIIEAIIAYCNQNDILITVDPKRKNFFAYKGVSLFKPNWKECCEALGVKAQPTTENVRNAAAALKAKLNADNILITLSSSGVYFLAEDGTEKHIQALARNIVDVSGAGDTVIAVCTAVFAAGGSIYQSAMLSNIAGGLVCEEPGVYPIDAEKLFNSL